MTDDKLASLLQQAKQALMQVSPEECAKLMEKQLESKDFPVLAKCMGNINTWYAGLDQATTTVAEQDEAFRKAMHKATSELVQSICGGDVTTVPTMEKKLPVGGPAKPIPATQLHWIQIWGLMVYLRDFVSQTNAEQTESDAQAAIDNSIDYSSLTCSVCHGSKKDKIVAMQTFVDSIWLVCKGCNAKPVQSSGQCFKCCKLIKADDARCKFEVVLPTCIDKHHWIACSTACIQALESMSALSQSHSDHPLDDDLV